MERIPGITKKTTDVVLIRFVCIENVQPLSVVDNPAFINLVKIGLHQYK